MKSGVSDSCDGGLDRQVAMERSMIWGHQMIWGHHTEHLECGDRKEGVI